MTARAICPLCDSMAKVAENPGIAARRFNCPVCGVFLISDDLLKTMRTEPHWKDTRAILSKPARRASDHGRPLHMLNKADVKRAIPAE